MAFSTSPSTETVAFFGASGGVGLTALQDTLATGRNCIALCRTPSKLTDILQPASYPNLKVVQGNAHDVAALSQCLLASPGRLVDTVVTTIGAKLSGMTIDDPQVCQKGMSALVEALAQLRRDGATGKPHIIACSTTGMSRFGRDIPIAMMPMYHFMLKVPHKDKIIMEDRLVASGENYTIVRPSFMVGPEGFKMKPIRVGIEDPKTGRETEAIGYAISKEDAGRWVAQNLVLDRPAQYNNKIVSITY
ncbi:hypothetical protein JX266_003640 [Neoarthrinium moseri]|nr:hypothetical protein JX266_003640 [Neoarthrinium moseri]